MVVEWLQQEDTMVETVKPNVGADMLRIHHVITRGLDVAAQRGAVFAQDGFPSTAIQDGFLTYLRALSGVLDAHHLGEDETAFPYFRKKMPDAPYDKLMADHRVIEGVLEKLQAALTAVAGSTQPADSLRAVNRAVGTLAGFWHPHIGIEETLWDPETVARLLDDEENLQLGQKIAESSQKHLHAIEVEIPFILYNLDPEDRAVMTKAMPPVVTKQLVPLVWRTKWAPMKPFLLD
jgi:Hemerythrin HHE cation binding domain